MGDYGNYRYSNSTSSSMELISNSVAGTYGYLSPQLGSALMGVGYYDLIKTDVFALGVTMLVMGLLKLPWKYPKSDQYAEKLNKMLANLSYTPMFCDLLRDVLAFDEKTRLHSSALLHRLEAVESASQNIIASSNIASIILKSALKIENCQKNMSKNVPVTPEGVQIARLSQHFVHLFSPKDKKWTSETPLLQPIDIEYGSVYSQIDNQQILVCGGERSEADTQSQSIIVSIHSNGCTVQKLPPMHSWRRWPGPVPLHSTLSPPKRRIFLY